MKQFNDIVTWLKGHISIISLVILGIGNHLVSDDLFCCPCGDDSLRAGYTFSLAFTPAVLLFVLGKFTTNCCLNGESFNIFPNLTIQLRTYRLSSFQLLTNYITEQRLSCKKKKKIVI